MQNFSTQSAKFTQQPRERGAFCGNAIYLFTSAGAFLVCVKYITRSEIYSQRVTVSREAHTRIKKPPGTKSINATQRECTRIYTIVLIKRNSRTQKSAHHDVKRTFRLFWRMKVVRSACLRTAAGVVLHRRWVHSLYMVCGFLFVRQRLRPRPCARLWKFSRPIGRVHCVILSDSISA